MEVKKTKKTKSEADHSTRAGASNILQSQIPSRRPSPPITPKSLKFVKQQISVRNSKSSTKGGYQKSERESNAPSSPITHDARSYTMSSKHSKSHSSIIGGDSKVDEVAIAVLGCAGVGKSTFVKCALDLKSSPTSHISSKKVSLEGSVSVLRLLELDVANVQVVDKRLRWPEILEGDRLPAIDGVLILYDVVNRASTEIISDILGALNQERMPTLLVASKCDTSPKSWCVTPSMVDGLCKDYRDVESFQTALSAPETHKRCISILLRNIILDQRDHTISNTVHRSSATTASQPTSPTKASDGPRSRSNHHRAASEVLDMGPRNDYRIIARNSEPASFQSGSASIVIGKRELPWSTYGKTQLDPFDAYHSYLDETEEPESPVLRNDGRHIPARLRVQGDDSPPNSSFCPEVGCANSPAHDTEDSTPEERFTPLTDETREAGVTFEDLVDRLLSPPLSRQDSKFIISFLCFYRKFAAPFELLREIIGHFENIAQTAVADLSKFTAQSRYVARLQDWISNYPGDFAHPATRRLMTSFMQTLESSPQFAAAHKEITLSLDMSCDDDDAEWAFSNQRRSRASTIESFLTTSSTQSATSTVTADSSAEDIMEPVAFDKALRRQSTRGSAATSTDSGSERNGSHAVGTFPAALNTVEDARQQARLLKTSPRHVLDKPRWRQFMETPNEHVALEFTRIDWILYSAIRPRDLLRHVNISVELKDKSKSLVYVNRMIDQFNHVAFWVANMILLREKPKHRAIMLEKFMGIAWKLRYLNNYNSLGAVIAGINGTAVHRLAQTWELVSAEARKQFMRLEILMGTAKSHSAYRLGWQNTTTPRIPFLPLHRRDLIFAEEGNKTFIGIEIGGRINWKKFDIMGDVINEIQRSQALPYQTIKRNEQVQRLVLDGKFSKDEDALYERSIQLEGQGVGEGTRKKFNWLQR